MKKFQIKETAGAPAKIIEALHHVNVKIPLSEPQVLEVFGGDGTAHITAYMHFFGANLHIWEIDEAKVDRLAVNCPNATVRNVDSFKEIQRTDFHSGFKGFDIIIIDPTLFGGDYVEYFDLFPHIFSFCARPAWFIITVCPNPKKLWEQAEPVYLERMEKDTIQQMIFNWDATREKFYGLIEHDYDSIVDHPDHPSPLLWPRSVVDNDHIGKIHGKIANDNRYRSNLITFIQRDIALWYMVQEVEKMADSEMIVTGGR
jgi:hypothetical protein